MSDLLHCLLLTRRWIVACDATLGQTPGRRAEVPPPALLGSWQLALCCHQLRGLWSMQLISENIIQHLCKIGTTLGMTLDVNNKNNNIQDRTTWVSWYYYYYNHFTTRCPGLHGWVGTRRINHSGFCWSRHDGVAVASAEPYASYLHFASEDNDASTSSLRFLRAGCPSWHPTNRVKALKAIIQPFSP